MPLIRVSRRPRRAVAGTITALTLLVSISVVPFGRTSTPSTTPSTTPSAAQGAALSRAADPVTSGAGLGVVTLGGQRLADQAEPDSTTWQ